MKVSYISLGRALLGLVAPALAAAQAPHPAEHHTFVMDKFTFESGATVPNVKVVYGTYGRLNAARDNVGAAAVALHGGSPRLRVADRPGLRARHGKLFLVATELFGNGQSSSPSNTPEPFHGPRFPVATIRDNVEAVHRLLVDELHVTHVRAVIGFSMGAEQAFQWAVSYPDFADRIVATSGTAKLLAARRRAARRPDRRDSRADPAFNNGDYTAPPTQGRRDVRHGLGGLALLAGVVAPASCGSAAPRTRTLARGTFDEQGRNFLSHADANDLILQARTWQRHDVGTTKGFDGNIEQALRVDQGARCSTCRRRPTCTSR